MEVEGLGARCALPSCGHVDYLPYTCGSCNRQFCERHRFPSVHNCAAAAAQHQHVPTCPICQSAVPAGPDGDLDAAMSHHIDLGCPKRPRAFPECALSGCKVRDPAATRCRACGLVYCVAHCVEVNHNCHASAPAGGSTLTANAANDSNSNNPFRKAFAANAAKQQKEQLKQQQQQQKKSNLTSSFFPSSSSSNSSSTNNRKNTNTNSSSSSSTTTNKNSKKIKPFINTPATAVADASIKPSDDASDAVVLAVFVHAAADIAPRHMRFSSRTSPGRIVDMVRKQEPSIPSPPAGRRYSVYAVRRDLSRVNLLPYVTPLRDLAHTVRDGDLLVLHVGDTGLDQLYLDALRVAITGPSRFFSASTSASAAVGTGGGASKGRKLPRPPQSSANTKCIMT